MSTPGPAEICKELATENVIPIILTTIIFYFFVHASSLLLQVLSVFGLFVILRCIESFSKVIWVAFLRPSKPLKRYGDWAIVTGASDGIGRAFAHELAAKRINLVLVGRSLEKLEQVAAELTGLNIEIRIAVVDFAGDLDKGLASLEKVLEGLEIGILVNSAGMSYPYARYFHEVDADLSRNLIKVNVEAITRMVQLVLPGMVKRKKGCIVNIGSGSASILPSDPLYALYAATKAFVDQFSRSLYVEYKRMGIDVQVQFPLYVATKMTKVKRPSLACPSAETYARSGMRFIGYEPRCTPYFLHTVLWWLTSLFREATVDNHRYKGSLKIRNRGMMREAEKKE